MLGLLTAIAWLIVGVISIYRAVILLRRSSLPWMDFLFHAAWAVIALSFLLPWI